ncbi:hypothetical protein HN011_007476, partial [Eciton burchellii]
TVYSMSSLFLLILLPTFPRFLGVFIFINISETNFMIQVLREYFIDQEKYFYVILLHLDAAFCIGVISLTAFGMFILSYNIHICGIFRIASYRIEQAMMIPFQRVKLSKDFRIHKNILYGIDIHRRGMELCNISTSKFEGTYCILILISVVCLSLNLYGLLMFRNHFSFPEFVTHSICIITILLIIFIGNYAGQEITNHYNYMFSSVYNTEWYETSLFIQKVILFILQRGIKNFGLVYGKLFMASMESTTMLLSTSMSYFTVLYSSAHDV